MAAAQLTPKQVFERKNLPYIYFILRPIGGVCVPIAAKLGASPNQVSRASILASLVGMALLATGGFALSLVGVAALHIGLILDMVDGDLARRTGKSSKAGEFLDALGGYTRGAFMLPALGIGISRVPDRGHTLVANVMDFPVEAYVQIGLWSGVLYLLSRLITLRYRVLLGESMREQSGKLARLSLNFEDMLWPLLVVAAATQLVGVVLLVYSLYYMAGGLYTLTMPLVHAWPGSSDG